VKGVFEEERRTILFLHYLFLCCCFLLWHNFYFRDNNYQEKLSVADHAAILRSDGSVASIHGGRPKQGIKIKLTR